jgi:hypothetical protein
MLVQTILLTKIANNIYGFYQLRQFLCCILNRIYILCLQDKSKIVSFTYVTGHISVLRQDDFVHPPTHKNILLKECCKRASEKYHVIQHLVSIS